jgi:hypothetical protein
MKKNIVRDPEEEYGEENVEYTNYEVINEV